MRTSSAKPNFLPFLSTPSARRATTRIPPGSGAATNFYPRPLRGGRPYPVRTCFAGIMISIHALREEGDAYEPFHLREKIEISIHALREEGDPLQSPPCALLSNFYPRPPRGGRQSALSQVIAAAQFLSTPSARRATCPLPTTTRSARFLSTPSARRATTTILTALRHLEKFLSTPSARRATTLPGSALGVGLISIHALREEGDFPSILCCSTNSYFYPRPPRGGRRQQFIAWVDSKPFLSTPSARRATRLTKEDDHDVEYFYPRPPRGGRRVYSGCVAHAVDISIHALREEGDPQSASRGQPRRDFYPRPPRGGRPRTTRASESVYRNFYPRPPRGGRPALLCCLPRFRDFYPHPPRGGRHTGRGFLNT